MKMVENYLIEYAIEPMSASINKDKFWCSHDNKLETPCKNTTYKHEFSDDKKLVIFRGPYLSIRPLDHATFKIFVGKPSYLNLLQIFL